MNGLVSLLSKGTGVCVASVTRLAQNLLPLLQSHLWRQDKNNAHPSCRGSFPSDYLRLGCPTVQLSNDKLTCFRLILRPTIMLYSVDR